MQESDLEARLARRLHERFDTVGVPDDLVVAVRVATSRPMARHRRAFTFAPPRFLRALAVVGALLMIVALAAGLSGTGRPIVSPEPSPTPTSSLPTIPAVPTPFPDDTQWVVLVPTGRRPSKADTTAALEIYAARLRAFGVGEFQFTTGNAIIMSRPTSAKTQPAPGSRFPSPTQVLMLMGSTGDIAVVALPAADYPVLDPEVLLGEPLPTAEPTLLDFADLATIATVYGSSPGQMPVTLVAPKLDAFARSHAGDHLAILLDGRIAGLANLTTSIDGSTVTFSTMTTNRSLPFPQLAAVFSARQSVGPMPDAWRGATMLGLPSLPELSLAVNTEWPGSVITSVELANEPAGPGVPDRQVWLLRVHGQFDCSLNRHPAVLATPCAGTFDTARVVLDAATAAVIRTEINAP